VDLHTISCPVLSVVGDRDKLVPPEGTAPLETALKGVDLQTLHLSAGHAGLFAVGSGPSRQVRRRSIRLRDRSIVQLYRLLDQPH
jgi:polyhydroxyalkanoate synthase subunit PhaC